MNQSIKRIFLLQWIILLFTACNPIITNDQISKDNYKTLTSKYTIGQTFTARYDGLNIIQIFIKSVENTSDGKIFLRLFDNPTSSKVIAESSINIIDISKPGFYTFEFEPQDNSHNHYYYLELSTNCKCIINLSAGSYFSYINGGFYQNRVAKEMQSTFKLGYSTIYYYIGILKEFFIWFSVIILILFIFSLPGIAIIKIFFPNLEHLSWFQSFTISLGIGLSIYPILFLWSYFFRFNIGMWFAILPSFIGIIIILWRSHFKFHIKINKPNFDFISFFLIATLISLTRYWQIRNLEAPMWGDSVQHTVMTQLILDHGGLFQSWLPYAPYKSLTVQFGFSLFSALYAWLLKINVLKAVLWMGQILNLIAILSLYPLALKISNGNHWAGLFTMILAGLSSPMPAYYVNWGRYAQLTGQAILPISILLTWFILESPPKKLSLFISQILISALVLAGMTLSYYRMPFFYASFIAAWGIFEFLTIYSRIEFLKKKIPILLGIIFFSIFFISPWLQNLRGGALSISLESGIVNGSNWERIINDYKVWIEIEKYISIYLIIFTIISIIINIFKKNKNPLIIILWGMFLFSLPLLAFFHIPGLNFIQTFSVIISAYIPISLLSGWSIYPILELISNRWKLLLQIIILILAIPLAIKNRSISNPNTYALMTKPDINAMNWINRNTSPDAFFLVEGFRIYNGTSIVGSDAGWWIPLMTHRQNNIPPQYALFNEKPITPYQNQAFINLIANLESHPVNTIDAKVILCDYPITHVYIGQRRGSVGDGAQALFQPLDLLSTPWFHQVYHRDGVYIFRFKRQLCP